MHFIIIIINEIRTRDLSFTQEIRTFVLLIHWKGKVGIHVVGLYWLQNLGRTTWTWLNM